MDRLLNHLNRLTIRQLFILPLAILFISAQALATAQAPLSSNHQDQLTKLLSKLLPKTCYSAGGFDQALTITAVPKPIKSSGIFVFSCERGLIWSTEAPSKSTLIYPLNKKGIIIDAQGNRQLLDGRAQRELGKLLNNLMGGNMDYIQNHFSLNNADGLMLTPLKKRMQKFITNISLAKASNTTKITMTQPQQLTVIDIFNINDYDSMELSECKKMLPNRTATCEQLYQ